MNHREGRAAAGGPSTDPDRSSPDTPAALCDAGLAYMQAGQLLDAHVCCTRALAIDSNYADAFHLLGLIHAANNELDTAVELVVKAIKINQTVPDYFSNLAVLMQRQNRFDEAFKSYDLALKLKPDFIAVWLNLADLLRTQKRFDEALLTYDHVLRLDARSVEAANKSGLLLLELNRHQEALARFELLQSISPGRADACYRMGICLKHLNRPEDAASRLRKSLEIAQNHEVHNELGGILIGMRKPGDALTHFRKALEIKPDFVGAINNSGIALLDLKHFEEALSTFDRAFSMSPDLAEALSNRAAALKALRRHDDALASHDRAIALRPDHAPAHDSRGSCLLDMMRLDEAFSGFQDALALQPGYAQAHVNLGLAKLLAGDLKTGWVESEWRWKSPALQREDRKFRQPIWLGDAPIDGKILLLHGEQGLGDTLQFCRYVPLVAARGAQIVLEVQRPLRKLLAGLSGASQVIAKGEPLPDFGFHCPLGSLPLAFDTRLDTVPSAVPYLSGSDGARIWKDRLGVAKSPRVGLVWSGNPRHLNDLNRSIPLETLLPLLDVEAQFVSLQKDVRAEDRAALGARGNVLDLGPQLASFADTAAIVENLDLVISVDTSVAHLAGALGRPIWVLLPYVPDWRWLLNRTDSPWYPTARLFRQTEARDWQTVVREVRSALQALYQPSTGH